MPGNEPAKAIRQAKILKKVLHEGKDQHQVSRELIEEDTQGGTSQSTVSRDWQELNKNGSLAKRMEELKQKSLVNAVTAADVEGSYLVQTQGKENMTAQEAATASTIGVNNQKRYSVLHGANTDEEGGELKWADEQ